MKQVKIILLLILSIHTLFAQETTANEYSIIDKKALEIPESLTKTTAGIASYITSNFKNDKDKSRAIFIWVASNIQYDIDNMFAINLHENREAKIAKSLTTRKGICENYAALFSDICTKSGIKSYIIEGYTKQNGNTDNLPHAWNAALIDNSWFLFDTTWGSGYVNGGKFYKRINNNYYKANPALLIKSHIPFDYLWQFLNYTITNQEFNEGKTQQNKAKPYFNFNDSIQVYESQTPIEQLIASSHRIEKNGVKNPLVFERLKQLKLEIENYKQNNTINLYNAAIDEYNEGINAFNAFITFKNKQFTPKKTDSEIQLMIDIPYNKLKEAKDKIGKIKSIDSNSMTKQLAKTLEEVSEQINTQQKWLKNYFSKTNSERKSMFYKTTSFGKPMK